MTILTRFAPSPTGLLHVGNVRTALVNWLYTRAKGGQFLLRMDDTDVERSKLEYVEGIKRDLEWLGLSWDKYMQQSDRLARYNDVKEQLVKAGRVYACYETQEELEIKRKMQLGRGLPPIYDRAALKLTDEQKAAYEQQGRKPHWRFLMNESVIAWNDEVKGPTQFEGKHLSDPVIIRADGSYTYMMPSTVDDVDMGVTHIIRGEDHVTNTAVQIQIFEAMGATPPSFSHLALLKTKDAEISKRTGGFDIHSLHHDDDMEAMTITSFLARLGTSLPAEPRLTLDELVRDFDINHFGKSPTNYDPTELERLNARLLAITPFADVKERLKTAGLGTIDESFWEIVKHNITRLREVKEWWHICKENLNPTLESAEDKAFAQAASHLLPEGEWNENTWSEWIEQVKNASGRKGKALFMPIRQALTAMEHGPELKQLLPLIGREKAIKRLNGEKA